MTFLINKIFSNVKPESRKTVEKCFKAFFAFFAISSVVVLFLITGFIVVKGLQPFLPGNAFGGTGFIDFIKGDSWNPSVDLYGIGYMMLGTFSSMLLALIIALPISLLAAIGLSEFIKPKYAAHITSAIELLAGIPSIIYGIFGLAIIVPKLAALPFNPYPQGQSMMAVGLVLAMMILPTIISVTVASLKSVPQTLDEASLGLGASRMQTMIRVKIPAAKSGILAAIVLGIGRAVGETMAVMMIAGNVGGGFVSPLSGMADFLFQPIRPLTSNIAMDMSYAADLHKQVLFSTALVLFIFIFILNVIMQRLIKGGKRG